jgi:hypothetical protein
MSSVGVHVFYKGPYPRREGEDALRLDGTRVVGGAADPLGPWLVNVTVDFFVPDGVADVAGTVTVVGSWGGKVSQDVVLSPGPHAWANLSLPVDGGDVTPWAPVGFLPPGTASTTYTLNVTFQPTNQGEWAAVRTVRPVGFRTFALVTIDDTGDLSQYVDAQGSGNLTMRFRVNGFSLFSRGANFIPTQVYESDVEGSSLVRILESAAEAGANTIRVWGGGIFQHEDFYDAADRLGLLVYHDVMYAQEGHGPTATAAQREEIVYQVRRLSAHPSVVLWDGCNECDGTGIYADFVMRAVADADPSRSVWPASPSAGWESGVDTLYSIPVGRDTLVPKEWKEEADESLGWGPPHEAHGPYQHGTGFTTVNDPTGAYVPFHANIPAGLTPAHECGEAKSGVYTSEFGCVSMSSVESMAPYFSDPSTFYLEHPLFAQRNYPCNNIIATYFSPRNASTRDVQATPRALYQCQMGAALQMQGEIRRQRSKNVWGLLTWQLNEIWPTGGWGSLEYSSSAPGQMIGGRWKPLHHLYEQELWQDVVFVCGRDEKGPVNATLDDMQALCYLRVDSPLVGVPADTSLAITVLRTDVPHSTPQIVASWPLRAPVVGASNVHRFCGDGRPFVNATEDPCVSWFDLLQDHGCNVNGTNCLVLADIVSPTGTMINSFPTLLTTPGNLELLPANVSATIEPSPTHSAGSSLVNVTLTTDAPAILVHLTTLAAGRFSDNVLLLHAGSPTTVAFHAFSSSVDVPLLKQSLRIEHAASSMQVGVAPAE